MYSKKHYILIAHTISLIEDDNKRELEFIKWCVVFGVNPLFDTQVFKGACKL